MVALSALKFVLAVVLTVEATAVASAAARQKVRFDIGPATMGEAVVLIGAQAGVTIVLADPHLAGLRAHPVHGQLSIEIALDRLTRGTGATARMVGPAAWRIEPRPAGHRQAVAPPPAPAVGEDILVTGSKRDISLASYPGSAIVTAVRDIPMAMRLRGSDALEAELPIISSTHLGSGRNKLFIRGIADSSFNGPSQGTVGQYLGEARLTYNAPDPDLALYDIEETEILEGPQGTLYGAGTLGGILRLSPIMPDLDRFDYGLSLGGATTRHGAASYDSAGLINLPIKPGVLGIRGLAYASDEGGYIDDPGRGLRDINLTRTRGGRLEIRLKPASDWTFDLTGVIQDINSRDGEYAQRGLPRFERESVFAQPFDNDYSLAGLVVRHDIGHAQLMSSTTLVHHDVNFTYDATQDPQSPRLFLERDHIVLVTNETRLSRRYAGGASWVIGVEILNSSDEIRRSLGAPLAPPPISGSRNIVFETALYGEATIPLTHSLSVTAGARVALTRLTGEILDRISKPAEPDRRNIVLVPSLGAYWRLSPNLTFFARYQEGFRPGGLSVSDAQVQRYRGDGLSTIEVGARLGKPDGRLQASVALSIARWKNIQADLVHSDGLPYTTNVGSGRIPVLETTLKWHPIKPFTLSAGLFLTDSSLDKPAPGFEGEREAPLPNVDDLGFHTRADLEWPLGERDSVGVYAALRYVGGSRLGIGPVFRYPQGHYANTSTGLRWSHGGVSLLLDVSNLLDDGRNQFALGNPFQVGTGDQITPLRPRTFRVGLSTGF